MLAGPITEHRQFFLAPLESLFSRIKSLNWKKEVALAQDGFIAMNQIAMV